MLKTYLSLTKPGIIWGNLIAATGGFMLAAQGNPDFILYIITMLGVSLVVASGCVYNNVIDTDIDSKMARTQSRALVQKSVSKQAALWFATLLGCLGFFLLWYFTNTLTLAFAAFGFFVYVVLYTMVFKRRSVHGTLVGSASGASPPVMGYVAVTGQFDMASLLIFLGFCAWQMPHSYAIAIFRKQDYQASNIPLLPLVKGLKTARLQMAFYISLFFMAVLGLVYKNYVSWITLVVMSMVCGYWLYQCIFLFKPHEVSFQAHQWGKRQFLTSIIAITLFSIIIAVDYVPQL